MKIDWEYRYETGFPIYPQVSRDNLVFHLSEHSRDGSPGTKILVNTDELDLLYAGFISKMPHIRVPKL